MNQNKVPQDRAWAYLDETYLYELIDGLIDGVSGVLDGTPNVQGTYRCVSEIKFFTSRHWPDARFYVEHPESKQLLRVLRSVPDRRCNGSTVVWIPEMIVLPDTSLMYVSNGPDITGKTLKEIRRG